MRTFSCFKDYVSLIESFLEIKFSRSDKTCKICNTLINDTCKKFVVFELWRHDFQAFHETCLKNSTEKFFPSNVKKSRTFLKENGKVTCPICENILDKEFTDTGLYLGPIVKSWHFDTEHNQNTATAYSLYHIECFDNLDMHHLFS